MQVVKKHKNCFQKYIDRLLAEGTVSEDEVSHVQNRVLRILQEEFDLAKEYTPREDDWLSSVWTGFKTPAQRSRIRNTGAPRRPRLLRRGHPVLLAVRTLWAAGRDTSILWVRAHAKQGVPERFEAGAKASVHCARAQACRRTC